MKIWPVLIDIIVILAVFCSPVLAISKGDLISAYKEQSDFTTLPEHPTIWPYLKPVPPATSPTQALLGTEYLSVYSNPTGAMVYLDGTVKGFTPIRINRVSAGSHQLKLTKFGYADYITNVTVVTGKPYMPFGNVIPDIPGCGAYPCNDVNQLSVIIH